MPSGLTYIVYAPAYNPDVGGIIFQHELVHTLNEMGERALLWPAAPIYKAKRRNRLKWFFFPPPYPLAPHLNTAMAKRSDLGPNTVVVYGEAALGNPLKAKNVVRWLLYTPGVIHPYEFGPDEMFFRVGEFCDLPEVTGGAPDLLMWKVNRTYRNQNRPDRKGICYMVRKGKRKPRIPETESAEAIRIDGMSHEEINDVFNRCEMFISYDEATMYSQYAAVCGCLSVVVPGMRASRQEWVQGHELARYGVAYGMDPAELEHARTTQHKVAGLLQREEDKGVSTVRNFVKLTRERFGN